jgi:hypothetical protein
MRFNGLAIGHTRLIPDALQDALLGGEATDRVVGNPPTGWGESHQPLVTETTAQITNNKAGVCRSKITTITGRQRPDARPRGRTDQHDTPRADRDREEDTTAVSLPSTPQAGSEEPAVATTMPFGKHKGTALRELPDPYLDWLLGADGPDLANALRQAMEVEDKRRSRHGHIPNTEATAAYLCELGGYASVAEMRRLQPIQQWAASQPDLHRRAREDNDTWRSRISRAHRLAHEQVA